MVKPRRALKAVHDRGAPAIATVREPQVANAPRAGIRAVGKNTEAIQELYEWLKAVDAEALKRFRVQVALAMTTAAELDAGNTSNLSSYRQLVKDMYDRIDRIYGTNNMDIVAGIQVQIDANAERRVKKGWG